jgi:hypothetical protein
MENVSVDGLAHWTARSLGRKRLLGLLGVGMAALTAGPQLVGAKQNSGKRTRKKAKRKCRRQEGQCLAFVQQSCEMGEDSEACIAFFSPCCDSFASCQAEAGFACLGREPEPNNAP